MHIPIDNKNVSSNIWYPFWLKKNPMNKIVIDERFLKMKKNTYIISKAKSYTVKHWVALKSETKQKCTLLPVLFNFGQY